MTSNILTSNDLANYFQTLYHINWILEYYQDYKSYKKNLLRNTRENKYPMLLSDKLFFDAITFHFNSISNPFRTLSEKLKETLKIPNVPSLLLAMGKFNEVEDEFEFEDEYDDELFEIIRTIKSYEKEIENYINSKDFLSFEMSMSEFLKWKDKDGLLFVQTWIVNIKDKCGVSIKLEQITNDTICKSWEIYLKQNKHKKFEFSKDDSKAKFPLYLFLIALEYMVSIENVIMLSQLPFTRISSLIKFKKDSKQKKEELPFCTDYPYSIKTSKSIWTVRKK